MPDTISFSDDKSSFFSDIYRENGTLPRRLKTLSKRATAHGYGFIAANKASIEQEFSDLYTSLQKQRGKKNREAFWFYSYYCSAMLESCYLAYGDKAKAANFAEKKTEIQREIEIQQGREREYQSQQTGFFTQLGKDIADAFGDVINSPKHISQLKNAVGLANVNRIYWFFCRTTLTKSLYLTRDLGWLDKLGNFLAKPIDVDSIVKHMEGPNEIFRLLSVGFFAIRLIMNAGLLLKHTFFPSKEEKDLSITKRFTHELKKRHADFLNDSAWGLINGFTNYNKFFHIAGPVANWMVAGFLCFDFLLLLWRRNLAEKEYKKKLKQYNDEIANYETQLKAKDLTRKEQEALTEHKEMLEQQKNELRIKWQAKSATFLFNTSAALLLIAGFSASMILSPPVLILACYVLCTFAVAMYLSADEYSLYKEKRLLLSDAKFHGQETSLLEQEYKAARKDFILTMVKNVLLPSFFIVTYAVCWQAALILTAVYLAYKLYSAYTKHQQKNDWVEQKQALLSKMDESEEKTIESDGSDNDESDESDELSRARM